MPILLDFVQWFSFVDVKRLRNYQIGNVLSIDNDPKYTDTTIIM